MLRRFVVTTILLSCFAAPGSSQSPSTPAPTAPSPSNHVVKKPVPKAKAAAKPAAAVDNGPCRLGVIPVIGEHFSVQKSGRSQILARTSLKSLRVTEDPLVKLDNSQFPDPPATASSSTILRERVRALVAAKLDEALPGYLKEE
jgi:hypothetical protein